MTQPRKVDTALLQPLPAPGVFARASDAAAAIATRQPDVLERLEACVRACYELGLDAGGLTGDGSLDLGPRRRLLRAALAEFASLDDSVRRHFGEGSGRKRGTDPRVHVLRLLRHSNVHLEASELVPTYREAIWHGPAGPQTFTFLGVTVVGASASIRATEEASKYSSTDLAAMTAWLDAEQLAWGIQNVILQTADLYVRSLAPTAG